MCGDNEYSDKEAGACTACPTDYKNTGDTANKHASSASCIITVDAGKYIGSAGDNKTNWDTCVAGTYREEHQVKYGYTSSCSVCGDNEYSDAGVGACTACATKTGYFNSGNNAESHATIASCKTDCAGGYYVPVAGQGCVQVGKNFYNPGGIVDQDKTLGKTPCPHDGVTDITTASTPQDTCRRIEAYPGVNYAGPKTYGTGRHMCFYDIESDGKTFDGGVSDGYLLRCYDVVMQVCDPGYWWKNRTDTFCSPVGYNFFGPVTDTTNDNWSTARMECPMDGMTLTETSFDIEQCYKEQLYCPIENGAGENTCNFDAEKQDYVRICTRCMTIICDTGYFQVDNLCEYCAVDHVCTSTTKHSCAELTDGLFTKSDRGTADVAWCWRECALEPNAYKMLGRDYNTAPDTCQIELCNPGYTLENGVCVKCPDGYFCSPDNTQPQSCADKTNGEYPLANVGSDDIGDCYKTCDVHDIVYGVAYPVEETVQYPNQCVFTCVSDTGNPGNKVDDTCIESSCNYNFEMINGVCEPCNRPFAISYNVNGNCVIDSCATGYFPNGQVCQYGVADCVAPNAVAATHTWNPDKNAFGECIITQCADGYHLAENTCQPDEQVCDVPNGTGIRYWNHRTNNWDDCVATRCNPGYTMDPSQTTERWAQCGRCSNAYGTNGEIAVSTFVQECEIAACMYQGEKYTLEYNECVFICPTITADNDDTGTQYWDEKNKKCVRACQNGYMPW